MEKKELEAMASAISTDELVALRDSAKIDADKKGNMSNAIKIFMNSIYGATGNNNFVFRHKEVAADITAESREFIQKSQFFINEWMHHDWHKDTLLHQKLRDSEKIKGFFDRAVTVVWQLPKADYVIYIDTDSIYVEFVKLFESIGFNGTNSGCAEFILLLNDFVLRDMFNKRFEDLLEVHRHCRNYLSFDLESVSSVCFFLAKKKYIKAYIMENDIVYDDPTEHISPTGIELVQSSTPDFCRDLLMGVVKGIVKGDITNKNYKSSMLETHKVFCGEDVGVEQKSKYVGLGKYHENITKADKDGWGFVKGAQAQFRGAARHNHLIAKAGLHGRYKPIGNHKVGWYMDIDNVPFSYHAGQFPTDIAPPVNNEVQFEKLILAPIQRLAKVAGFDVGGSIHDKYVRHINLFGLPAPPVIKKKAKKKPK